MISLNTTTLAPQISIHLDEVFATAQGAVFQDSRQNKLVLHFNSDPLALSVNQFISLHRQVLKIDVAEMFDNADRAHDVELVLIPGVDRVLVLTLTEVVALRELLAGTKVMLELNSMVSECLSGMFA